jgi:biotin operon repressor
MAKSKVPEPEHTEKAALFAVDAIRRLRAGHDSELGFYPAHAVDDDDIDAAVLYLHRSRFADRDVRRAELPHRAVLISYVRQRDTRMHDLQLLNVLEAAREVDAPSGAWARQLGLSRQNVWHVRRTLQAKHRGRELPPSAGQLERDELVRQWLTEHRDELLAVAAALVDHQEKLRSLVSVDMRAEFDEAVQTAGVQQSSRPNRSLASAIGYAAWLLGPDAADRAEDPTLCDVISAATRVRTSFNGYDQQ